MEYLIVDYKGDAYSEELAAYGKYMSNKLRIKNSLDLILLLANVFNPTIIIVSTSENTLCLKTKNIYVVIAKEDLELIGGTEKANTYEEIYEIKPIINCNHTLLSLV